MSEQLTLEERATNYETMQHISLVREYIEMVILSLLDRGRCHDRSKLMAPEVEDFTKFTPRLSGLTYGSPEYIANKKEFQPTLDHHYANNRHHPEHFKNGIEDMNLVDLIEMFCDWNASGKRHKDGNLRKSIEINATRFNINPQLVKILENSMDLFDK